MFRYRLVDQRVPAMCLSLAAARLMAELPSGKAPTTRVRRRIARKHGSARLRLEGTSPRATVKAASEVIWGMLDEGT
jgi:hypothetical protein